MTQDYNICRLPVNQTRTCCWQHLCPQLVAAAVASKQHLTKLNMRENELADIGCVLLATAASRCTAMTTLDFCGNQAHKVGAVALAKAAASLPDIQLLALDENCISESGG